MTGLSCFGLTGDNPGCFGLVAAHNAHARKGAVVFCHDRALVFWHAVAFKIDHNPVLRAAKAMGVRGI